MTYFKKAIGASKAGKFDVWWMSGKVNMSFDTRVVPEKDEVEARTDLEKLLANTFPGMKTEIEEFCEVMNKFVRYGFSIKP